MVNDPGLYKKQMLDPNTLWEMNPYSMPRTIPMGWEVSALFQESQNERTKEGREERSLPSEKGEPV
jgi:hypothetical protein